jgi:hypothetical protein
MTAEYRLVDLQGNDVSAQYISHFDQIRAGFGSMMEHLTQAYLEQDLPETFALAANYNSLRAANFDQVEVFSMLAVAMEELAKVRVAEKTSARHGNPMRKGRN